MISFLCGSYSFFHCSVCFMVFNRVIVSSYRNGHSCAGAILPAWCFCSSVFRYRSGKRSCRCIDNHAFLFVNHVPCQVDDIDVSHTAAVKAEKEKVESEVRNCLYMPSVPILLTFLNFSWFSKYSILALMSWRRIQNFGFRCSSICKLR